MKPTKNRIWCVDCKRPKMVFETKKKAENFIKFNSEEIERDVPNRAYYCKACGGWHVTSKEEKHPITHTRRLIEEDGWYHVIGYINGDLGDWGKVALPEITTETNPDEKTMLDLIQDIKPRAEGEIRKLLLGKGPVFWIVRGRLGLSIIDVKAPKVYLLKPKRRVGVDFIRPTLQIFFRKGEWKVLKKKECT